MTPTDPTRKKAPSLPALLHVLLFAGISLLVWSTGETQAAPRCDVDDGGLRLAEGFCALEVARELGPVRNLVVAPDGDLFVARRLENGSGGGVLALRDTDGDGRVDERRRFGRGDGHGIALTSTHLYLAAHDEIVRWPWTIGQLEPSGEPETIVSGFPDQREHRVKAIALGADGALYVEVGAPSNSCQKKNRKPGSPGLDPCPQLERHAGIWRYASDRPGQLHSPGNRHATGLRHALALATHPGTGELWALVNGRDSLGSLWGFDAERNAALPAEEMIRVREDVDLGWPYCYHDGIRDRKVLAPEYGGDGEERGRCEKKTLPDLAFPGHWAPMALVFHPGHSGQRADAPGKAFPERYHGGAFVAFRGSWNRAPLPQEGYRIAFVPFTAKGEPAQPHRFETFAIGAASPTAFRMTGVAFGPDGSLFVSADDNGRIWRILADPEAP